MSMQTILVVSADPYSIRLINTGLAAAGYRVLTITRGAEVLSELEQRQPDLLIIDWRLPDLSGLAVLRSVRAHPGSYYLPVIFLAADMTEDQRLLALEVGADLCLTEPLHTQVFAARVRSLLRRVYS